MTHPLQRTDAATPAAALRLVVDETDVLPYATLVSEAQSAERQGRRDEARTLYEAALRRLHEAPRPADASSLLRWIARTHQEAGDAEAALDCLEAAIAVGEAHGDVGAVGHAVNLQAIVHHQQGLLDEAERLYHQARDRALRSGEARLAAMTAQNLGVIANIRGDFDTALRHYEASLADYRTQGLPQDVCVALNNLGMLYTHLEQWARAETAYTEALQIAGVLGNVSMRIMIEVNVAESLVAQREFTRAREVCDRAMALSRDADDDRAHGELQKVYGIIARETGDHPAAEAALTIAQQIAERRQDLLLLAECTKEKAELHQRQGRNRDTLQCLNRSHRIFAQLRARRELADVDCRMTRLEGSFLEVVRHWSESIESKDRYTQGHCERVADIACALAARAGLDAQSLFWFRIGAMLHDVGKLVIPSEILNKPTRLSDDEWTLVRQHPSVGVEMLADIEFPWDVRPIVESHHERWDGKGYPHGLAGESIPLTARILCIADVYDALTSERSYKKALSHGEAIDIMRHDVGRQFDPELFALFEEIAGEIAAAEPGGGAARPPRRSLETTALGAPVPAHRDELTGLPLRRAFIEHARRALAAPDARHLALLVVDVDDFKLVNDTYGHLDGDEVLRRVAAELQRHVAPSHFLGRYAGDEFVVLLGGAHRDAAMHLAERLRSAVQALPLVVGGRGGTINLTLSIGVATSPEHGTTVESLFAAADAALYEAKRRGRNRAVHAGDEEGLQRRPALRLDAFSGRREERRRLVQLFADTTQGEPRVVAIVGEAGVGKTAIVRELGPDVRMRAGSLVIGRCLEAGVRPPYGAWAAALNAIRILRIVPDRPWRELSRLVPALGTGEPPEREGSRVALFEEVAEYLRLAASGRPLVIVLDDMQWADGPSWDLLEYVMSRLERDRIMLCLTIREEDAHGEPARRRARLSRDERFHELRLARLTRDEMRLWIEQVLQQDISPELLAFLYRQTEGNPFFTVQVLRTLMDEESLWWNGTRWEWRAVSELRLPVAVSDLIARRVARLSPAARRTLAGAAVIGRAVDVDLAVAAGIATEDELLDAIDEGLGASVLEHSGLRGDDRISFSHGLLVDVMRRGVNPHRLKRVHARVAEAMSERAPHAVAEIALHFDAAGLAQPAYEFAVRAGERAAAVYAHEEATAFLRIAERHAATPQALAEVRLRLARVAEAAGRYDEAAELCRLAADWFEHHGGEAIAAECRRMLVRLGALQGQPAVATRDACRWLLSDAERLGLESERIALLTMLSQAHHALGDMAAAEHIARECLRLAEGFGDERLLADALTRLGTVVLPRGANEALELHERALAICTATDDVYGQVRCDINIGVTCSRLGDAQRAETAYARALSRGRDAHSPDLAGIAALNLGVLSMKRGRYDFARARMTEALDLFARIRSETHRVAALYNLAHLAREEGKPAEARDAYMAVAALARELGLSEIELGASAGAGLTALEIGAVHEARSLRDATLVRIRVREDVWFTGRELVEALAIRLALAAGDTTEALGRFRGALSLVESRDAYGAAWLLAACAPLLFPRVDVEDRDALRTSARFYTRRADALGFLPLSARFALLLSEPPDGEMFASPAGMLERNVAQPERSLTVRPGVAR